MGPDREERSLLAAYQRQERETENVQQPGCGRFIESKHFTQCGKIIFCDQSTLAWIATSERLNPGTCRVGRINDYNLIRTVGPDSF